MGLKAMTGAAAVALAAASAASQRGGDSEHVQGVFCSAIALDGDKAPERIQLFPRGPRLETVNYDPREFRLSDPQAVAAASMEDGLDLPVDWEHAQAVKADSGERTETAGWIRGMELREDGVLRGRVRWTAEGRASVESRAYRYFSPYFLFDRASGEVLRVLHGGLVKTPAFAMPALAAAAAGPGGGEETGMNEVLKKILKALGLADDATGAQAVAAIAALRTERDEAKAQAQAAETPSLDRFVPRSDFDAAVARAETAEARLAETDKAARDEEIKKLLDDAQAAGKITPGGRVEYEAACALEGGLKAVKSILDKAPVVAEPTRGMDAPPTGTAGAGASARGFASSEEAAVAAAFGRDAKFLAKHAPVSQGVS